MSGKNRRQRQSLAAVKLRLHPAQEVMKMSKTGSYADLKTAYKILEMIEEIDAGNGKSQTAADLKREIRKFTHTPVSERRIIQDDGIDGYTELLPLPAHIKSVDVDV